MNNQIILKAEDLIKSFQIKDEENSGKFRKVEVLKSVSLEIDRNKISVIIGASGTGKSTLLHLLSCLDRPDSGKVFYSGKNIFEFSDDKLADFRNNNIGFVFQFHHLLPEFSAIENIMIPQLISGKKSDEAKTKANKLLTEMGLDDRKNHKPAELSGGEQQRVALARALANDPAIIFADEPTGNLDSVNSDSIHNLFLELRNNYNKTFVIATHNPSLVKLADKVYEMKDGKIIDQSGK